VSSYLKERKKERKKKEEKEKESITPAALPRSKNGLAGLTEQLTNRFLSPF